MTDYGLNLAALWEIAKQRGEEQARYLSPDPERQRVDAERITWREYLAMTRPPTSP